MTAPAAQPHQTQQPQTQQPASAAANLPVPAQRRTARGGAGATIAILAVSAFLMILNETVLTVALPRLMSDFSVDAVAIQWLTTGFLLTMAVAIPTTGYFIQRFRTRSLFISALALFTIGTALSVAAPGFEVMLLARIVQAAGTAVILPLLMTTTLTTVAPERRGTVMGLNSVVISVAPAIGPTLSGAVIAAWDWRALFGLMLAITLVVFALGLRFVRADGPTRRSPFDVFSVILSGFGFGGIVYALASITAAVAGDWVPTAVAGVVGVAALTWFVARQRALQPRDRALLDLRPIGVRRFRLATVGLMAVMATMLGSVVVVPITLQLGLGASILATGLILLPGGVVQGLAAPVIGHLYDRIGPRPIVIPGAVLLLAGQLLLASVSRETSLVLVAVWYVVFCLGIALVMTPLMTVSLSSLPRHLYGHGSAIVNTMQQLSGAAGTALLVTAMSIGAALASTARTAAAEQIAGNRIAFIVGAVIAAIAVVICPLIDRPTAAESDGSEAA